MSSTFATSLAESNTRRSRLTWITRVESMMDAQSFADLRAAVDDPGVPAKTIHRALVALRLPYCPAESTVLNSVRLIRERA